MKGSVRKRGEKWSYYFSYKQDGTYKKKEKGNHVDFLSIWLPFSCLNNILDIRYLLYKNFKTNLLQHQ